MLSLRRATRRTCLCNDAPGELTPCQAGTCTSRARGTDKGSSWVSLSHGKPSKPASSPYHPRPQAASHSSVGSVTTATRRGTTTAGTGQHRCHRARRGCQDQELLCDQLGRSRRPHRGCPEFWDNLGISVCQGRLLGSQQGAGLFLKVALNQMVVATVTAALLWHRICHTSLPQHFQLCSVK